MKINYDILPGNFNRMFTTGSLLILGFIFVGIVITVFLARSIRNPIIKILTATEKIRNEEYDIHIQALSNDEIGQLSVGINRMTGKIREGQNKLKQYNIYLEELVEQRSRDLIHAEKMASLGQLTAGVAHELKNPLNFINNFSALSIDTMQELNDLIDRYQNSPEDQSLKNEIEEVKQTVNANLEVILNHSKRADGIIKLMLQHSRDSGTERQPTDINSLLRETAALVYHGMRANDPGFTCDIRYDLSENLPVIQAVTGDISRVILNIIQNALYETARMREKHPDYEPIFGITTRSEGNSIVITLRDNGSGIPEENRDKIFFP